MHPIAAYYTAYMMTMWAGKGKTVRAKDLIPSERKKRPKIVINPVLMSGADFNAAIREMKRQAEEDWTAKRLAEDH